ncbi:MAG: TRM11 family SAM-dependent methyltransferase, partial [Nitrososphaerales archaeon]
MIEKYLAVPAYGKLSSLELATLRDSSNFHFEIIDCSADLPLLEIERSDAKILAKRQGGFFKLVKISGKSKEDLLAGLPLPDDAKFNWTVSSYGCDQDVQEDIRYEISNFLKSKSLGKSRYVKSEPPSLEKYGMPVTELRLADLEKNILSQTETRSSGLEIVALCKNKEQLFGYTEFLSDLHGYQKRDFARSYQDPTTTIGPRLARVLVNLTGLQKGQTLLDPFCGLGTILQEAMMCGYNAVGVDISTANVRKTISNMDWFKKEFRISPKLWSRIIRADSTRLEEGDLQRVDGIATEPLLVPKFEKNPNPGGAEEILREVRIDYRNLVRAFGRILRQNQKAVVVAPDIIDDMGRTHT